MRAAVFRRIATIGSMASRFEGFSSVAAVDRKWFSAAVLDVSNDGNGLGQPQTVGIRRENVSAAPSTSPENHFRFGAATVELD